MPFATVNGIQMRYEVRGKGDPVLLITGTAQPGTTFLLDPTPRLQDEYEIIVFDHCGVGLTEPRSVPYSTRMFAEDAAGLLDHLGVKKAHLLGHSMGGRVLQWLALDRPDLVRSLVFAATGSGNAKKDETFERGIPLKMAKRMAELGWHAWRYDAFVKTFFTPEFAVAHPEVVNALVAAFWAGPAPTIEQHLKHVQARQQHELTERLAEIDHPALVMDGELDSEGYGTGSHVEQSAVLHTLLPRSELAVIPATRHGFFWQAPEESARVLKAFWRRH